MRKGLIKNKDSAMPGFHPWLHELEFWLMFISFDLKSKYLFGVRRLSYFVKIVNFPKKIESSQRNYYMQYDIVIMENTVYAHLCRVNTSKINVTVNT